MPATKRHPACTIHEDGMWLPQWLDDKRSHTQTSHQNGEPQIYSWECRRRSSQHCGSDVRPRRPVHSTCPDTDNLSVSVSLCRYLSVAISLSLLVCLCLPVCTSLCLSPTLSLSASLSLCLCLSLSLCLSVSTCLSVFACLSPFCRFCVHLCHCLSVCLSQHPPYPTLAVCRCGCVRRREVRFERRGAACGGTREKGACCF